MHSLLYLPVAVIREYASCSVHRNDSELPLTQFKDPARITFSHLRPSRRKFSPQDIIFLTSFPKFQVSTSQNHGNMAFYNFSIFIWVVHNNHHLLLHHKTKFLRSISPKQCGIGSWNMHQKCLIRWSPVHCHYEKRSKGIISAIGSLEKPLILPKFAHSISVIMVRLSILLGIILFVSSLYA